MKRTKCGNTFFIIISSLNSGEVNLVLARVTPTILPANPGSSSYRLLRRPNCPSSSHRVDYGPPLLYLHEITFKCDYHFLIYSRIVIFHDQRRRRSARPDVSNPPPPTFYSPKNPPSSFHQRSNRLSLENTKIRKWEEMFVSRDTSFSFPFFGKTFCSFFCKGQGFPFLFKGFYYSRCFRFSVERSHSSRFFKPK